MRKIASVFLLFYLFHFSCFSQQDTVHIFVIGLTCSSCSKAVEEKLIQIPFVKKVKMNLNSNEALVLVDFSQSVDWLVLANAVINAGFSVGKMNVPNCNKHPYVMNNKTCTDNYVYIGPNAELDIAYYTLVGKKFSDKKTYKVWLPKILSQGYTDPSSVSYYYYY
jgi:copper chaperone CopZ